MDISNLTGMQPNPGSNSLRAETERAHAERKRIPMSVPRRRLQCTPIPGYHLYWAREEDVGLFLDAGYEFVNKRETHVNYRDHVAGDSSKDGNQDLGDRVKVWAGRGDDGKPYHHILMKIRLEWYEEDQNKLRDFNAKILQAIFRGEMVVDNFTDEGGKTRSSDGDTSQRYVDQERTGIARGRAPQSAPTSLFQRQMRKRT